MKTNRLRRHCLPALALLLPAFFNTTLAQPAPPAAAVDSLADADLELLGKAAKRFVEAFNQRDAAAIAALFLPQGETASSSGETYRGREAIQDHYAAVFVDETAPLVSLEAQSVRLVGSGVVVEDGVIHLTTSEDEPVTSVAYSATHSKQPDGSWLIATHRDLPMATPPAERLKPLHWLVGEWTLEGEDGLRVDMVLDLDDSGSYLLGESLVTDAEGDSQSTHLRIGWNPATASIYWWTFDSKGGFTSGPWARNGEEWTIATTGFTADAEANSTTQTLTQVRADTMVWAARDRLLVDETLPDISLRFVRRAPDPGLAKTEPEPQATEAGDDAQSPDTKVEDAAPAKN
ncbi:MAG: hypothetical protein RLZZ214_595 [Verrucomicrobiota bacterium]|jgi:uncharacterized protein (TIGR02246 family)